MTLDEQKAAARKAAFARRKEAHSGNTGSAAGMLSSVLAGYRGVPCAGYMPIRTEIDPLPAMAEAAAHGPVGVPVIVKEASPLYFEPELVIVPLVAFTRAGGRLGYGGGFYDRTLELLRAKRATLAIGFAYIAQECAELPLEATDQPLDMIVTEREIIEIKG
ncbi:MAG: 5-formyltetrahydrofolate cyclo-ligase [Rhodobacteraceae bacterium]|nr:5-formyltetrahydrofolate cyclo-ligase [Paracoccaceae bacterium]